MSFNVGDTVAIWNRYYTAAQTLADRPFDAAGLQTTFGVVLGRAPDDPTFYAVTVDRTATGQAVDSRQPVSLGWNPVAHWPAQPGELYCDPHPAVYFAPGTLDPGWDWVTHAPALPGSPAYDPHDPALNDAHFDRTVGNTGGVGVRRVYFDSHGDGTGTSAELYLVRVRDITAPVGSGSDRVYPVGDLITPSADVLMPATAHFRLQTVTTVRGDNA